MQRPTAVILIIIDGLSDVAATPLQAAATPTLDRLAAQGRCGLIDPVSPGLACGSDTAHLSIFGYDPTQCYRGRGAFEAMGAGMSIGLRDVAFKCNFARMRDDTRVVVSRCAHSAPSMGRLAHELVLSLQSIRLPAFPDVRVDVAHAGGHRCIVAIRGKHLSDEIGNTDPLVDGHKLQRCAAVNVHDAHAVRTAAVVNELSDVVRDVLRAHPRNTIIGVEHTPVTNVLLLRGASERIDILPFQKLHGVRAFLIAPTKIIAGIGVTADMHLVKVHGATGGYDTDLKAKAHACVDHLMTRQQSEDAYKYSLGVVHVKAVDEAVRYITPTLTCVSFSVACLVMLT